MQPSSYIDAAAQLERVLATPGFQRAGRLSAFLRFVVHETLAGKGDQLKESLIGVEVYGRKPGYDLRSDPIVRVEAGKLRARLREYYGGVGRPDPVVIEVPKGGYVPLFSSAARAAEAVTVAVLPFVDMSPDHDQDYFCEGISEEITNALTHVKGLRVASRTSAFQFKGRAADIQEIARLLGASAVVEGSVRKSGARLRINARLVQASDGYHLWSERYDRGLGDVFLIQDEIARAVVRMIAPRLVGRQLIQQSTSSAEAYRLYLQGRYFWNRRPGEVVKKALECFEKAVALDPQFAAAYAGIADAFATLGSFEAGVLPPAVALVKASSAAARALEIDPELAEAHATLGYTALHYDWDLASAEARFRHAIELNPAYTGGRHWYSHCLIAAGRIEDSLAESRRALEIDPVDLVLNFHLAWHYQMARQPDETIEHAERVVHMDPNLHWGHYFLASGFEQKGMLTQAIDEFRKADVLSSGSPVMRAWLGHACALAGDKTEARRIARELVVAGEEKGMYGYEVALIHAALGDLDIAFQYLDRARRERSCWISYIRADPRLDPLRGDARFRELEMIVR